MEEKKLQISQRLIRKGALLEETYQIFHGWKNDLSFHENFNVSLNSSFKSEGWKREVYVTLNRRFRDSFGLEPLIVLAKNDYNIADWKFCLHFWIASQEKLYADFLDEWLFPQYAAGCFLLRTADVALYVKDNWKYRSSDEKSLSEYAVVRGARDLLRMSKDFGFLEGDGPVKKFSSVHFSDELFLYFCHVILDKIGTSSKIVNCNLWRLLLLDVSLVHSTLLRLHQYNKVHYQFAGSLIQLTLPCSSSREYVERMVS